MKKCGIVKVAVPSPLRRLFDYLPPRGFHGELRPGMRVRVSFGRRQVVGLVMALEESSEVAPARLKAIEEVLDASPLLSEDLWQWLLWLCRYYHHPPGEALFTALPQLLRQPRPAQARGVEAWRLTGAGLELDEKSLARAPKQRQLWQVLKSAETTAAELNERLEKWRPAAKAMVDKGWLEQRSLPVVVRGEGSTVAPTLNQEQQAAVDGVCAALGDYACFVLEGVTGSGKTEVYLGLIEAVLARGEQALVLIPEIGLSPQLVSRFRRRLKVPLAVLHSGLNEQERLAAWLAARDGEADVVIGTRSALFTPLPRLGLIILDEEHDLSYKQQDGLRYSARDAAVQRAFRQKMPVVLGSATPSLESLANVGRGRYGHLLLRQRAGDALPPKLKLLDLKGQAMEENLSAELLRHMGRHLKEGGQVLLFLNRRGFAPTLICHDCGWLADCRRCDRHMTIHQRSQRLRCHHCGAEQALPAQCPACSSLDLRALGYGTERVEQILRERFADHEVIRIDRDTTRRKGSMQAILEQVREGCGQILLGTQMLAKGHDFPNVTLVGILDADQGLFGTDFRSGERLAQLVVQVAGRAGRGNRAGEVVIQTHHPEHPWLQNLVNHGYDHFAKLALAERRDAHLPPFVHAALFRAEANDGSRATALLERLRDELGLEAGVEALGPVPSPLERRAGLWRWQLLLLAEERNRLHQAMHRLLVFLEGDKAARQVRWSLDVDPQDMT